MTNRTWAAGDAGDWFDPDKWTPAGAPQAGDTLTITSGNPVIANATIENETINLVGGPITLEADSVTFQPGTSGTLDIVAKGDLDQPLDATLLTHGTTSFEGLLDVESLGGGELTIDAESDGNSADFTLADRALAFVNQESILHFEGSEITNDGVIDVQGRAEIAAGVDFTGSGMVLLEAGGRLDVAGTVDQTQLVVLIDAKETLNLEHPSQFQGELGLTQVGGSRIDLDGVRAHFTSFSDGVLTLYNSSHKQVAQLSMELVNPASFDPLPPDQQILTAGDFTLKGDGHGGTLVSYAPQGPTYLEGSLPVAAIAETGSTISLQDLFAQAFGTADPSFFSITLLPESKNTPPDKYPDNYWGQPSVNGIDPLESKWIVNGQEITGPTTVNLATDDVQFLVGNNIANPPSIEVQVTPDATGTNAEFVTYDVWSVDQAVADLIQASSFSAGQPNPFNIINSALSYQSFYGNVLNTDLCNWIADNVAAAAGATMPIPDADLDPSENVEGGFWRIAYQSSDRKHPVVDWGKLVKPGDIVRLEWTSGTGHSTTDLAVNPDGSLVVYDNIDFINTNETIGVHDATYWEKTNPAGITIYRLDPDHQYLIKGTDLGEVLQGSVFDNLIKAGPGADTLIAGPSDNTLIGGHGQDTFFAGAGSDTFVYKSIGDSRPGATHRDVIMDFEHGPDQIDLSRINAQLHAKHEPSLRFIGARPLGHHAGEIDYVKHDDFLVVRADIDGNGKADFQIEVHGVDQLLRSDFIL